MGDKPVSGIATPGLRTVAPGAEVGGPTVIVGETAVREIVVETTTVRATFSNRGGRLLHWMLKDYRNEPGTPLDLVPQGIGDDVVKPFTLVVDDAAVTDRINNSLYRVVAAADSIDATTSAQTITFELSASDGLSVTKTFVIEPKGYLVTFSAVVQLGQARLNPVIHWGPGLGDEIAHRPPSSFFSPNSVVSAQPMIYKDGAVERVAPTEAGSQEGTFRYAGTSDHYFASLLLNQGSPVPFRIDYAPVNVPVPNEPTRFATYMTYSVRFQAPPEKSQFFFGPKSLDDLKAIDSELTRAIHFGMFSLLAVPLLGALQWVHGFVGNWGWAIVALTILINLAMFPLRHKSVVSMKKMQELQPQMKAIQDRYAKPQDHGPGAAEDEHRGHGALQDQGSEPGQRLRADAADHAVPVRVLRHAVGGHRNSRRGLLWLDPQPVGAGPVLHYAGPDGRGAVLADQDDTVDGGPGAAEDHDVHAADVRLHVVVVPEWPGDLLAGQYDVDHRTAVRDQLFDWRAG